MKRRTIKKRATRGLQSERRRYVHARGCVRDERDCWDKLVVRVHSDIATGTFVLPEQRELLDEIDRILITTDDDDAIAHVYANVNDALDHRDIAGIETTLAELVRDDRRMATYPIAVLLALLSMTVVVSSPWLPSRPALYERLKQRLNVERPDDAVALLAGLEAF